MSNREKRWTPGPWFACRPGDLGVTVAKLDNEWCVKCDQPVEPGEHDANLIAAAPDLVEALASLQAWVTDGGFEDTHEGVAEICGQARAALAKAYGEPNE